MLNEIERALAAPIDKSDVKTRKQGPVNVSYITARVVMNRLDTVVGPSNWRDEYRQIPGGIECTLYIRMDGEWIGKTDAAEETKVEPVKGAYSDALKRAACKWGIARELYREGTALDEDEAIMPQPEVPVTRAERSTVDKPEERNAERETPPAAHELNADKHWYKNATTRKNYEVSLGNLKKTMNITPDQVADILGIPADATKEDLDAAMAKFANPGDALNLIREKGKQIA